MQHILAVIGLYEIDVWCYLPSRPEVHIAIARNNGSIKRMLEIEHAFWQQVVNHRKR